MYVLLYKQHYDKVSHRKKMFLKKTSVVPQIAKLQVKEARVQASRHMHKSLEDV